MRESSRVVSTRLRVVLLLASVLFVYLLLNAAALGGLVFPAFAAFEREDAIRDIGRVANAIRREHDFLADFSRDWAHWDETYAFVETFDQDYFDGNLSDEVTQNTPTDVIALYGADGRPRHLGVYGALDPQRDAVLTMLGEGGAIHRHAVAPLLRQDADADAMALPLMAFAGRPLLVAGHAILRSDGSGPARGVLLMARLLDDEARAALVEQTSVPFAMRPIAYGAPSAPGGKPFTLPNGQPGVIHAVSSDRLELAVRLPLAGGGAFELITGFDRRMTRQGTLALGLALAISTLTFVLLVGALYYRLLAHAFLLPLRGMVKVLRRIEEARDLSTRLPVEGAAELQRLARVFNQMMAEVEQRQHETTRLSLTDALTGLPNRRQFEQAWNREWQRSLRQGEPIALLLADVDHFKAYNDHYGHPSGDDCLQRVARAMHGALKRPSDIVARYGGEEFALILPNTDAEGAAIAGGRILEAVRALDLRHAGDPGGRVTISLGGFGAIPGPATRINDWIAQADAALYEAKANGRDRLVMASSIVGAESVHAGRTRCDDLGSH